IGFHLEGCHVLSNRGKAKRSEETKYVRLNHEGEEHLTLARLIVPSPGGRIRYKDGSPLNLRRADLLLSASREEVRHGRGREMQALRFALAAHRKASPLGITDEDISRYLTP